MGLAEIARRMVEEDVTRTCDNFGCLWGGHAPDCPWLALPKIVAALEAMEQIAVAHEEQAYPGYWTAIKTAVDAYREVAPRPEVLTGTTT